MLAGKRILHKLRVLIEKFMVGVVPKCCQELILEIVCEVDDLRLHIFQLSFAIVFLFKARLPKTTVL
jgi:hypothetical protein